MESHGLSTGGAAMRARRSAAQRCGTPPRKKACWRPCSPSRRWSPLSSSASPSPMRAGCARAWSGCRRWSAICSPGSCSARSHRALRPADKSLNSLPRSASRCCCSGSGCASRSAISPQCGESPFPAPCCSSSCRPRSASASGALGERNGLQSQAGRRALGWLVMQDLIAVGALVMIPPGEAAGSPRALALQFALKLGEVLAFAAAMLLVGRRVIPRLLARTAREGSRELFRLAVIVCALGIAAITTRLTGVSLALGAFFAGVVIADSDVSHQAAGESVPVQQVFTVLFFVSVGMLFDPAVLAHAPLHILAAIAAALAGNCL